jgi:hypothetical protein
LETKLESCPFLFSVMVDWMFVNPVSAYCRRPSGSIRVPANATLERVCMSAYAECPGYVASAAAEDLGDVAAQTAGARSLRARC